MRWVLMMALLALAGCSQPPQPTDPPPLATASPQLEAEPTASPPPPGSSKSRLKAAVLTSDPKNPVDQAEFPLEADSLHLLVSLQPTSRKSEFRCRFTQAGKDLTESVSEEVAPGQRQVNFEWKRPAKGWPQEPIQVSLYLQDGLLLRKTFQFTERPPEVGYQPKVTLTEDPHQEKPRFTFTTGVHEHIFLVVATEELPQKTPVRAVWIAKDVEGFEPDELLGEWTIKSGPPTEDGLFMFSAPQGGFIPGSYQVDVYFRQQLVSSQNFWITEKKS